MSTPKSLCIETVQDLTRNAGRVSEYIESLLVTLQSADEELQAWCHDALRLVETTPIELGDTLAEYCLHDRAPVAAWGCKLLSRIPGAQDIYQDKIVTALREHADMGVRQQAASALASFPKLTDAAIESLQAAAHSGDPRLERLAAATLQQNKVA